MKRDDDGPKWIDFKNPPQREISTSDGGSGIRHQTTNPLTGDECSFIVPDQDDADSDRGYEYDPLEGW